MYIIIGASSFIGSHLYNYCKKNKIDVLGTYYKNCYNKEWIKFDLQKNKLHKTFFNEIKRNQVKAIILCGANASIDDCKKNEKISNRLNIEDTQKLLKEAADMQIKSVFLSSEAVFDGKKGMYNENDLPHPITLYGKQKLYIEEYILQNIKNYLVLRISRAVGSKFGENDIFNEFYHKIVNDEKIICLKNQSFCITEVDDIAKIIVNSLERDINGLYHLSSNNYISRYELARLYAKKVFNGNIKVYEKEYEEMHFLDKRHIKGGLDGNKLSNLIGFQFLDTEQILEKYLKTFMRDNYECVTRFKRT